MILDFVAAHRKLILAALSLVLVQVVDSETADWIVTAVGSVLVGVTPNDPHAVRRIYRKGH